jgi:hypothetical protein
LVSGVTVHEVVALTQVTPPGLEVTVYPVMAAPPLDTGAVQDTTDCVLAFDVAVTAVGAPGVVAGTAAGEATEDGPAPKLVEAVTVKV